MASEPREIGHFLIARGGPIYEMQQRLGLLSAKAFRAGRRALRALSRLKIETLLSSGAWATRHFRASERDMLGRKAVTLLPLVAAGATHLLIKEITSVFKRLLL